MNYLELLFTFIAKIDTLFLIFLSAYLIGSIPVGYIIVKIMTGKDIREVGSGSTGATNVKRVLGTKFFFLVMILDAIKGIIPILLANKFIASNADIGLPAVLAAIGVIIGHSKPVFLRFKGGKSVATGVGTLIALNWQIGLIIAGIWAIITYFSKYVSLGSIIAIWISPVLMYYYHQPIAYIIYCGIGAFYITYLHKENIKRLFKGEENKVR